MYSLCADPPSPPLRKNRRRGACDSPSLIVYGNNFAYIKKYIPPTKISVAHVSGHSSSQNVGARTLPILKKCLTLLIARWK